MANAAILEICYRIFV